MPSIFAENKPDKASKSITNQNTESSGSKMVAVPALQRKEGPQEELQMKAVQVKGDITQKKGLGDEEELPVQGKFAVQQKSDTLQKEALPEEEPLQKKPFQLKADVIQKAGTPEEELPVQGKFAVQQKSDTLQKEALPEEEPLQKKPFQLKADAIQKAGMPEEELPIQGKFEGFQKKENKTGLPDNLKSGVEQLSGHSLNDVSVHYNSSQPAQLNAHAYAQGTDIHIAPGQEQHLPHEAWHVAQQKQGRVQPTMQMKAGVPVNDDPGLENEADVMGAKAQNTPAETTQLYQKNARMSVVQRLLNAGEQDPLRVRCLALETRIETAIGRLPLIIRNTFNGDHKLIEPIRAELVRVRAPFGTDDQAAIVTKLNEYEVKIAALEVNINTHLDEIQRVTGVWNRFTDELEDSEESLVSFTKAIYQGNLTTLQISNFDRLMQRQVIPTSKEMSALRKNDVNAATALVTNFVELGYIQVDSLNVFYASGYDAALDRFGAAASLTPVASSGQMQWVNAWEFHIHAIVTRAGGLGTPVTGFNISTGHIKPSNVARGTGESITVPAALNAVVIQDSTPGVIRWANQSKTAGAILAKQ